MRGKGCSVGERSCEWWCDHPEEAAETFVPEPPGDDPDRVDALSGVCAVLIYDQGGPRAASVIEAMMKRMDPVSLDMLCANLSWMQDRMRAWSETRAEGVCPHCRAPLVACSCSEDRP